MITKVQIISIGMPKDWLKSKDSLGKKFTLPALQVAIEFWHDRMLKRHFERGAAAKYDYKRRGIQTIRRKEGFAQIGNRDARLPLVMTGQMKREVTRMVRISGTGKSAQGVMTGPRQLSIKRSNYPDLAREITAVTRQEADELAMMVQNEMIRAMNEDKTTTVKMIG